MAILASDFQKLLLFHKSHQLQYIHENEGEHLHVCVCSEMEGIRKKIVVITCSENTASAKLTRRSLNLMADRSERLYTFQL